MALDPRIPLMGRAVEVPDAVVRRGQRAHARLLEDQDETLRRQADEEAQFNEVMRQTGGDLSPGMIARTFGMNPKAGATLSKLAIDRAKVQAEVQAQNALTGYRGAQTAGEQQKQTFAAQTQPNVVAKSVADAAVARQKAGTMAPAGDLESQFAARAAQQARDEAATLKTQQDAAKESPFQQFYRVWLDDNGQQATAANEYQALGAFKEFNAKKTPGVDVPYSPAVAAQKQQIAAAGRRPAATGGGSPVGADGQTRAQVIAGEIMNGNQSPELTGMYKEGPAIREALGRAHYNHAEALSDWKAVQKHLSTLNGAQQERLRQAVTFTNDSIDVIDGLYNDWTAKGFNTQFKALNKGTLAAAKQLGGEAGATAQALEAQVNDLVSELGTVYKGGNSSTDESLRLAAANLKGDWNEETFKKAIGLIRKNLQIRSNSIRTSAPAGVSDNSPYIPQGQKPTAVQSDFNASKYEKVAVGPNGHKIGLRGGKLYDVDTGQEVK